MKLNKVNIGAISKFFSSAAVIYGSAFINNTFYALINENTNVDPAKILKAAFYLKYDFSKSMSVRSNLYDLRYEFAKQAFFTIGSYKLVDSAFSFDSIHSKAVSAGFAGALSGIIDYMSSTEFLYDIRTCLQQAVYYKVTVVNMICKGFAAAALTYINYEEPFQLELAGDVDFI